MLFVSFMVEIRGSMKGFCTVKSTKSMSKPESKMV